MAEREQEEVLSEAVKTQISEVLSCCKAGNVGRLREMILKENADEVLGLCVDPDNGKTVIHLAAIAGNTEALELLLEYGAPWNAVDHSYRTAGDDAEQAGQKECYEILLNHGCRSELILGLLGRRVRKRTLLLFALVSRISLHFHLLESRGRRTTTKWTQSIDGTEL